MHSQQKRWPQGVAVECLRSSKHRVHSGVLQTALSSRELLWGKCTVHNLRACRSPSNPLYTGGQVASCTPAVGQVTPSPAVGQVAVQPPLLPGSLLLPEAVYLQPHGQYQMQQGDESQQLVACASPQVLSSQAASTELLRQVTPPHCHQDPPRTWPLVCWRCYVQPGLPLAPGVSREQESTREMGSSIVVRENPGYRLTFRH